MAWVKREAEKREYSYLTDRKVDLTKPHIGTIIAAFLELIDTPSSYDNRYPQVPTINEDESALEWRPVDYYDGGSISEEYTGAEEIKREFIDGGTITMNNIVNGGGI